MSHHDQRVLMERVSMLEERVHSYRAHCFALQKELNAANEKIDQLVGMGINRGLIGRDFIDWATKHSVKVTHVKFEEPAFPNNEDKSLQ